MNQFISLEQFHDITRPLIDLPISLTWRGYGTAIFFELGELNTKEIERKGRSTISSIRGEATIDLEIGWRVERARSVWIGSSSSSKKINNVLKKLQDHRIVDISVQGRLPELIIQMSGNLWLHSFTTWEGQPEWTIFLNNSSRWVMTQNGNLIVKGHDKDLSIGI